MACHKQDWDNIELRNFWWPEGANHNGMTENSQHRSMLETMIATSKCLMNLIGQIIVNNIDVHADLK